MIIQRGVMTAVNSRSQNVLVRWDHLKFFKSANWHDVKELN